MVPAEINKIFKFGSTTYSTSSIFFPPSVRDNVAVVYAFVRTIDNFVDQKPQGIKQFKLFKKEYYQSRAGFISSNPIINLFNKTEKEFNFDPEWTDNFIQSMEIDITKSRYKTIKELEQYMYGSANVIGLYMAKLLHLPTEANQYAQMLGKSMQLINFIRDIGEDLWLGRIYFPQDELKKFKLKSLVYEYTRKKSEDFIAFMHFQIDRYFEWQSFAEKGFKYIPKRYLIPIKTASDMYKWTGEEIKKNPFIIYRKKVKPSKFRIIKTGIINSLQLMIH